MKKLLFASVLALLFGGLSVLRAQNQPDEYLGLPGDNLNLYAVMNLFQEAETLEAFERNLNDPEQMINNLDLNRDNLVDYIMVQDYKEDNIHQIVLRVALNQQEYQDVAVFTVEKFRDGAVQIQLIGDEALYGRNYIVEPVYAETPNPGYRGNARRVRENVTVVGTTYYEIASWPVIIHITRPGYRVWRSSWHWGYYPTYWHPWTPHYYHYYYGYHYNWQSHYYAHYRPWNHHRSHHYHNHYYTEVRHSSPTVVVNINNDRYRNTYSRPEKRSEGEVLFTQRHPDKKLDNTIQRAEGRRTGGDAAVQRASGRSDGNTLKSVPARGRSESDNSAPARARSAEPNAPRRVEAVNGQPARTPASRQSGEVSREPRRETNGSAVQRTAPRQQTEPKSTTAPMRRENNSPAVRQDAPRQRTETPRQDNRVRDTRNRQQPEVQSRPEPRRQTNPAPSNNVGRSSSERNTRATQPSAPNVSRSSRPESRPSSVERSQPSRSESPRVRESNPAPSRSSSRPSSQQASPAPRRESSTPAASTNRSAPQRNSEESNSAPKRPSRR